jgi:uncharacterized protein
MKRIVGMGLVLGVVCAMIGLGLCEALAAESAAMPKTLTFVAASMGSSSYARAVAWSDLLQNKLGITITPEPSAGPVAVMNLIKSGKAQLGSTNSFDADIAFQGKDEYKPLGKIPIRTLQVGTGNPIGLLARRDSGLKTIADLKGKKVVDFPTNIDSQMITKAYLKANGLDPKKDISYVPCSSSEEGLEMVIQKQAQAVAVSLEGSKTKDFDVTVGGIFLPSSHDEKALQLALSENPVVFFELIKAGAAAIQQDTYVLSHNTIFFGAAGMSDELAYTVVKTCIENAEELAKKSSKLKGWTLELAVSGSPVPFHNGAIKYYKEKGVWTDKLDSRQKELMQLIK